MSTFAKKMTSAVAGLAIVMSIVAPTAGVSAAYSSLDAANKLATLGIIVDNSGAPAAYRLADTITREELSKVIANLGGLTVTQGESVFTDADFSSWAEKYAKALNEAGYAASNAKFNPKFNATKIEALKWVMEAQKIATGTGDNWMAARVDGAVKAGVADNFSDYTANATRGQVFIWAANAIDANEDVSVDDDLLCSILGTCPTTPTDTGSTNTGSTTPTTPVVVTGGDVEVTLSPLSPTSGMVAAGLSRTPMMAIDVTAGNTDVTLKQISLDYVGLSTGTGIEEVALYNGNKKVTRGDSKSFNSKNELDLSFENDVVVQAGKTVTFVVSGKIAAASGNVAHQIAVTDVKTTADKTVLGTVKSVVFNVYSANNVAKLKVDESSVGTKLTIGKESTLADFNLEEKADKEDAVVKSLTFKFSGTADFEDDIAELSLKADGKVIASNLSVDSDDEIVVDLDYTIPRDKDVDFELLGVVTGSVAKNVTVDVTDVYAVGATTGVMVSVEKDDSDNSGVAVIEGSKINASWERADKKEAKPGAEDVLVGTFNLSSDGNYTINNVNVKVESTNSGVLEVIDNLELDGRSADTVKTDGTTTNAVATDKKVNFGFEDISVNNEKVVLDLVADIMDDVKLNGDSLKFTISVTSIDDEENDETYTGSNVTSVLSSNSFTAKTLDIESASLALSQSKVSARNVVLGNGVEVVLFEGKMNVGDAADVTLNNIDFSGALKNASGAISAYDFEDIIDTAELNVGGVVADADVKREKLEFNNADITVAAGADNVQVLVTAVLKDYDGVANGDYFTFDTAVADISAEDEDGEDLLTSAIKYTPGSVADAKVTMTTAGTLKVAVVNNKDYKADIKDVVLAGQTGVAIAEMTLEADQEDIDVNDMYFFLSGAVDFSDTIETAKIMVGNTTLADGAKISYTSSSGTIIHFEDFTVEDTGSKIAAKLVVDLNPVTTEGGSVSATPGTLTVKKFGTGSIDAEGASSNEDIVVSYDTTNVVADDVVVVPALVTLSVPTGGSFAEGDITAALEVTLDLGNNDLDNDSVIAKSIKFAAYADLIKEIINLDNNDEVLYNSSNSGTQLSGQVITFTAGREISDGDRLEIRLDDSALVTDDTRLIEVLRGSDSGFVYTVGASPDTYNVTNDSRVSLGTYKK